MTRIFHELPFVPLEVGLDHNRLQPCTQNSSEAWFMTESVVPRKKIRRSGPQAGNAGPTVIFKTGDDIRQAVTNQPSDTLKTCEHPRFRHLGNKVHESSYLALQSLRNHLTIYPHEIPISSNDERLLLLQDWLTKSPGAPEIFEIWDSSQVRNAIFSLLQYC